MGLFLPNTANNANSIVLNGIIGYNATESGVTRTVYFSRLSSNTYPVYYANVGRTEVICFSTQSTNRDYQFSVKTGNSIFYESRTDPIVISAVVSNPSEIVPAVGSGIGYEFKGFIGATYYHCYVQCWQPDTDAQISFNSAVYSASFESVIVGSDMTETPPEGMYPITYSVTNGTIIGPAEAAIGTTVVATGMPNANYAITDYTTQIAVTCNDIPVPFTFNATTNEITFEMPDPTSG